MKRAALFGGSFDPPHIGHMEIIDKLKNLGFVDKVIVMPTYLNPFKKSFHASPQKRLEWLRRIFENDPKVVVSDFEVRQKRRVPTIESVEELQKEYDEIYVAIGADNLKSLPKWHRYEDLKKMVKFIVFTRGGEEIQGDDFIQIKLDIPVSSSDLRRHMQKELLPSAVAEEIYNYYKENNERTH